MIQSTDSAEGVYCMVIALASPHPSLSIASAQHRLAILASFPEMRTDETIIVVVSSPSAYLR